MTIRQTQLDSGLIVVTDDMPGLETISLGVYAGAGSRNETAAQHGLSHLLEHMAFKGTKRRSAKAIAEEIEQVGGDLNAATGVEQTAYYARVLGEDYGLALDLLSDILIESQFDPHELEREKAVILQEIGAVEDTPDDLVHDMFSAAAYPGQPIGRPILGEPETVTAFDRHAIGDYLGQHYRTGAMVVAAAGALDHERIVEESARRFAMLGRGKGEAAPPARYAGGEARQLRRLEQAHLVFGFEGFPLLADELYAALIFTNALGGGMSSRLFQEVRENRGLAYTIQASHWTFADTGVFNLYAGTAARDVAELSKVALDCLMEATETLSETEVARAKAQMKVSIASGLESSGGRAEQMARQLLAYGRIIPREETMALIEAVDVAGARAAGRTMLASAPTLAALGPVSRAPDPARIAERMGG